MKDLIEKTKEILQTKGIDFSILASDEIEAMELIIIATAEALSQSPVSGQLAIEALQKIANPRKFLKDEAEKEGGTIHEFNSYQLSVDHIFLKDIAKKALEEIANCH